MLSLKAELFFINTRLLNIASHVTELCQKSYHPGSAAETMALLLYASIEMPSQTMGTEVSHLYEGEGTVDRELTAVVRGP